MTDSHAAFLSEADYRTIEGELEGTEKGRRFLRAYLERNRAADTRRLLDSIARLHRLTAAKPSLLAEAHQDIKDLLRNIVQLRLRAKLCRNDTELSLLLLGALHEIEASLIALSEAWEEGEIAAEPAEMEILPPSYSSHAEVGERSAKLFGELALLFSTDAKFSTLDLPELVLTHAD